jgi:hypothetical protein
VSRFASSRRLAAGLAIVAVVAACDLGTVTVARTNPTLVVHGVLNPSANDQVILVERTLTGAVQIPDSQFFDAADPILSAGGIPVRDAVVEIIDSAGRVTRGVEDRTVNANGKGSGVYRVPLRGSSIVQGTRYQLHVRESGGEELTAFTRVPRPPLRQTGGLSRTLNRDHDAILAQWSRVPTARSYAVRIESPFGPFFLFTDSTAIRITGDLRNLFAGELQRVFIPGFRQDMIIAAVDSNFYDYYRTNNDPFTGAGIISRVNGGLGMFGSIVSLNSGTISVTADQTQRIEGRFRLTPLTSDINTPTLLTLYVESDPPRSDLPAALSGRYSTGTTTTRIDGVLGQQLGSEVTLVLLSNQLAGDTLDVWTGELQGDTLRGSYRKAGREAVFARIP